jgi:hypothetical protein
LHIARPNITIIENRTRDPVAGKITRAAAGDHSDGGTTMRRHLWGSLLLIAAFLAAATASAGGKKDDGFVLLFNGKDLTGWKIHPKPSPAILEVITKESGGKVVGYDGKLKDGKTVPLWRVEDGILIGSGPPSHLFSERGDYENFVYRIEALINDKGNSGQYFRTQFGPGFPKGYEAQINATHTDKIRTGSLYPAFGKLSAEEREKILVFDAGHKAGEWFTQEVLADGGRIVIKVNGKTTVDFSDAKNTYPKGHFALQGHDPGTVVKFKKIEVKELPAGKTGKQIDELKRAIELTASDAEMWMDRASWSRRMFKRGFLSRTQVAADDAKLRSAELTLQRLRADLKALTDPEK